MLDFCGRSCFCSLKAFCYRYFQFVSPALYLTCKTLLYITKWHISDNIYTDANIGGLVGGMVFFQCYKEDIFCNDLLFVL